MFRNRACYLSVAFIAVGTACGNGEVPDGSVPDGGDSFDAGPPVDAGCLEIGLPDGGCSPLVFSNICTLPTFVVLNDGASNDDQAASQMGVALRTSCSPSPVVQTVDGVSSGLVATNGAPLAPRSDTLICTGGGAVQPYVGWLEASGATPVVNSSDGTNSSFSPRGGTPIFSVPAATLSASLDYFVLELVRSEPTGPLSVVSYGFFGPGTAAASWFFEQRVMAQLSTSTQTWYVVRWSDTNGSGLPDDGDDFTVLASGH